MCQENSPTYHKYTYITAHDYQDTERHTRIHRHTYSINGSTYMNIYKYTHKHIAL